MRDVGSGEQRVEWRRRYGKVRERCCCQDGLHGANIHARPNPNPLTHDPERAPKDLVRSVLRRNRLTAQPSRSNCLLENKFRHQCPPRLPCKGSALPTGFPSDHLLRLRRPNILNPKNDTQLSAFTPHNLLGPMVVNSFYSVRHLVLSARAEGNLLRTAHSTLLSWGKSRGHNCWRVE